MLWHKIQGAGGTGGGGWDISAPSYVQSFSVTSYDGFPVSVSFKPDGTRMYVTGSSTDKVYEFDLSTAWDVSTATFSRSSPALTAQDGAPYNPFFKTDGTLMYIVGASTTRVFQYTLTTAWDVSTATYVSSGFYTLGNTPRGLYIRSDGAKMYTTDLTNDQVREYDLSTAWDVTTASFVQSFSVSAQGGYPTQVQFKPDGTKMFTIDFSTDDVFEYDLSTAWDVSTASYSQAFDVSLQEATPFGFYIGNNGKKLYAIGYTTDAVHEYDL